MFVDASAILAILLEESDAAHYAGILDTSDASVTSPVTIFEVVAAFMTRKRDTLPRAQERLNRFLAAGGIRTIAITPEIGALALSAFDKYGKGRGHKAQLNMGDCFAYACAKSLGVPLLYKGDDFAKTDLA